MKKFKKRKLLFLSSSLILPFSFIAVSCAQESKEEKEQLEQSKLQEKYRNLVVNSAYKVKNDFIKEEFLYDEKKVSLKFPRRFDKVDSYNHLITEEEREAFNKFLKDNYDNTSKDKFFKENYLYVFHTNKISRNLLYDDRTLYYKNNENKFYIIDKPNFHLDENSDPNHNYSISFLARNKLKGKTSWTIINTDEDFKKFQPNDSDETTELFNQKVVREDLLNNDDVKSKYKEFINTKDLKNDFYFDKLTLEDSSAKKSLLEDLFDSQKQQDSDHLSIKITQENYRSYSHWLDPFISEYVRNNFEQYRREYWTYFNDKDLIANIYIPKTQFSVSQVYINEKDKKVYILPFYNEFQLYSQPRESNLIKVDFYSIDKSDNLELMDVNTVNDILSINTK
ncbi:hypothetical protein ACXX84_00015 [Mycoplasma sp. AC157]